jgi:hypothetical protein
MSRDRMEKLSEQLSFRITRSFYEEIDHIARTDRRKLSEVAVALLERGVAAFRRDGELFEPSLEHPAEPGHRPGAGPVAGSTGYQRINSQPGSRPAQMGAEPTAGIYNPDQLSVVTAADASERGARKKKRA